VKLGVKTAVLLQIYSHLFAPVYHLTFNLTHQDNSHMLWWICTDWSLPTTICSTVKSS